MRRYGCLESIIMSFYSRDLYRDVVLNWSGAVVLYLLLLLFICIGISSIGVQQTINTGYSAFSNEFFPQIPPMIIKNGEIKTPEDRPYFIVDRTMKDKKYFAIIDTSGKYTSLDSGEADLLVTRNMIYYTSDDKIKSKTISSKIDLDIKPLEIQKTGLFYIRWLWLIFLPLFVLFAFIYRIMAGAIYALAGKLFATITEVPLTYGEIFKISIFAMTPAIILSTFTDWFHYRMLHDWVIYFILTLAYIIFGINSNKKTG